MAIYTDIDLSFKLDAATGDIGKLEDRECIKNNLKVICSLDMFDIPFDDSKISKAKLLLFEIPSQIVATTIRENLTWLIKRLEPRIQLMQVSVEISPENNGYTISVKYMITSLRENDEYTFDIKRIR